MCIRDRPNGEADPNATFGGPSGSINPPNFSNVISTDGSRVFWTDTRSGHGEIYAHRNGTSTIPISAGAARYWTASPDGRDVIYTEGPEGEAGLWRFNFARFTESIGEGHPETQALGEAREELVGSGINELEPAGVLGVLGINQ